MSFFLQDGLAERIGIAKHLLRVRAEELFRHALRPILIQHQAGKMATAMQGALQNCGIPQPGKQLSADKGCDESLA